MKKQIIYFLIFIIFTIGAFQIYLYSIKIQNSYNNVEFQNTQIGSIPAPSLSNQLPANFVPSEYLSKIRGATTVDEVRELLTSEPQSFSLGMESEGEIIFTDNMVTIGYVIETCRRLSVIDFETFIEEYFDMGDGPRNEEVIFEGKDVTGMSSQEVIKSYTGNDYCTTPIFTFEGYTICHTDFDRALINILMKKYVKHITTDEFLDSLSKLEQKNIKESFMVDFYKRLYKGEIKTQDDC